MDGDIPDFNRGIIDTFYLLFLRPDSLLHPFLLDEGNAFTTFIMTILVLDILREIDIDVEDTARFILIEAD